jgi:hypothetical protein
MYYVCSIAVAKCCRHCLCESNSTDESNKFFRLNGSDNSKKGMYVVVRIQPPKFVIRNIETCFLSLCFVSC